MAGPGEINNSQPFKLTVESFNRPAFRRSDAGYRHKRQG